MSRPGFNPDFLEWCGASGVEPHTATEALYLESARARGRDALGMLAILKTLGIGRAEADSTAAPLADLAVRRIEGMKRAAGILTSGQKADAGTLYLAAYCESPHCVGTGGQNGDEIELPERFGDLGDSADDVQAWGMAQLEALGWSIEDGEHRCPACTEAKRIKDLSGLNPD